MIPTALLRAFDAALVIFYSPGVSVGRFFTADKGNLVAARESRFKKQRESKVERNAVNQN